MKITTVVRLGKGRYRVGIEGADDLILYRGELGKYDIREGAELKPEDYAEIRDVILWKRAQNRLLFLLQKKDYTRQELLRKLHDGGYPADVAERAVEAMEAYGYVNDESYAMRYVQCYGDRRSRGQLRSDLIRKGIRKECAEAALAEYAPDAEEERSQILRLLEKRHYDPESADDSGRRRQYAYLMGKGYRSSDIIACLG